MIIDIDTIPDLDTDVAVYGSSRQVEVGGPVCLGFLIGLGLMVGN